MKKSVTIGNKNFSYIEIGHGFPCVLIHGNRDCKELFIDLAQSLFESIGGKYLLVDLRGFGESDKNVEIFTIDKFIEDIEEFIDFFGYKSINYIGHSLGSTIGIRMASIHKDVIKNLILISGSLNFKIGFKRPIFSRELFLEQLKETNKMAEKIFFQEAYPEIKEKILSNWMKIDFDVHMKLIRLIHPNLDNDAQGIRSKTLLIYGENDKATTVDDGKYMNKLITNSILEIIPNAGHYVYLEMPIETNKIISNFLK
jgi:pimeloyl-ACP methyl ester carboxylesterase